ncbi:MAG: TIGR03084 family metal-binding protein [Cellulomonas sp.]|nr:TIGR03084 family metal-binding protein [Cellulomonas sp.]
MSAVLDPSAPMADLLGDLAAEQAQVDVLLDGLPPEQWESPAATCAWTFKEELLHLAAFDWAAVELLAGRGANVVEVADANFGHDEVHRVTAYTHLTGAQVLTAWRTVRARLISAFADADPKQRVPWAPGLPMSAKSLVSARLMELWAHSVDLYDALGIEPVVKDRIASTLFLSWQARPNAYRINGLELDDTPLYLDLVLPSGASWSKGDPDAADRITGTARDWALVAVRRRRWQDTGLDVVGAHARQYAEVVQTFAGGAATAPSPGTSLAGTSGRKSH